MGNLCCHMDTTHEYTLHLTTIRETLQKFKRCDLNFKNILRSISNKLTLTFFSLVSTFKVK